MVVRGAGAKSKRPCRSLGGYKGGVLFREREHPLCPVQCHRRCPPPPMAGKRKSTTTFVVMLYGAGDEARSRHCRAATRTAGDKRPTGAFSRFARALFDPLPAGTKKSALLRRTSVLRSKTLAEGEFTSPEHLNFLPESKKRSHNIRCDFFFWSGRRGSLAALPCRDTHSGRQTPHRGVFSLRSRPVRPSARWNQKIKT